MPDLGSNVGLQVEIMALFLIYEFYNPSSSPGDLSGWDPYVCLLPRKAMSTMFWTDHELEALGNPRLLNRFWAHATWQDGLSMHAQAKPRS